MLNEPHYPSQWSVALVLLSIALLIAAVFVWAFVINFGSVVIQTDHPFALVVNGDEYNCDAGRCELSLPPKVYEFKAEREGFYPETFQLQVSRWQQSSHDFSFRLIPHLGEELIEELPAESSTVFFRASADELQLFVSDGGEERLVNRFETLTDPVVHRGGNTVAIVDEGRFFVVEVEDGKRLRKFDDTVTVQQAVVSDSGKRILLSAEVAEVLGLWVFSPEPNDLSPLSFSVLPGMTQWEPDSDHRVFVLTDQLADDSQTLVGDLVETLSLSEDSFGLFSYNLDTQKAQLIIRFDKAPLSLERVGQQYFVEIEGGQYKELLVR